MEFARAWWMKEPEPLNQRLRSQTVIATMKPVDQVSWRLVLRKGVAELLSGPGGRGLVGDGDVDDSSAVVREDHEHE